MLIDTLKQVVTRSKDVSPLYLRNLLKENLQYYILNYIYGSVYGEQLIIKGGTALRFCFDLPRLSEDLDFDIKDLSSFELDNFTSDLKSYFQKTLQYGQIDLKIAGNKRTIYLKFPILHDLNVTKTQSESNILHIRIDLSPVLAKTYTTEISIKSTYDFSFLIKRYSLPDLFAGKLAAILTRKTIEGKTKTARIKGRDYFDLIWFLEKSVVPNWKYIEEITSFDKKTVLVKLDKKVKQVTPAVLKADLLPFFENIGFVEQFVTNYQKLYQQYRQKMV